MKNSYLKPELQFSNSSDCCILPSVLLCPRNTGWVPSSLSIHLMIQYISINKLPLIKKNTWQAWTHIVNHSSGNYCILIHFNCMQFVVKDLVRKFTWLFPGLLLFFKVQRILIIKRTLQTLDNQCKFILNIIVCYIYAASVHYECPTEFRQNLYVRGL